jgi:hypothetical protein
MVEAIPFDVIAYPNPSNYQFTLFVEGGGNDKVETWFTACLVDCETSLKET